MIIRYTCSLCVVKLLLYGGTLVARFLRELRVHVCRAISPNSSITNQLCRSCWEGLSWLVTENNDMLFFQLFQYCLGSGLGTIGDFFSEQLPHDPYKQEVAPKLSEKQIISFVALKKLKKNYTICRLHLFQKLAVLSSLYLWVWIIVSETYVLCIIVSFSVSNIVSQSLDL